MSVIWKVGSCLKQQLHQEPFEFAFILTYRQSISYKEPVEVLLNLEDFQQISWIYFSIDDILTLFQRIFNNSSQAKAQCPNTGPESFRPLSNLLTLAPCQRRNPPRKFHSGVPIDFDPLKRSWKLEKSF